MVFLVSELDVQFCFLQVIGLAKSQIEQKFFPGGKISFKPRDEF